MEWGTIAEEWGPFGVMLFMLLGALRYLITINAETSKKAAENSAAMAANYLEHVKESTKVVCEVGSGLSKLHEQYDRLEKEHKSDKNDSASAAKEATDISKKILFQLKEHRVKTEQGGGHA